jgi:CRISPR-associated protein Csd1
MLFREQVDACLAATADDGIRALSQLLATFPEAAGASLPKEVEPNHLFAFVYEPDIDLCVHQRAAVRDYWKRQRSASDDESRDRICLVSGKPMGRPTLVPLLKKVPGGTSSGVSLVSFNAPAFESFGWDSNENASISRPVAEACATALNRLLDPSYPDPRPERAGQTLPKRHVRLSADTVVCYWVSGAGSEEFLNDFGVVFEPDSGQVGDMYRSMWSGKPPAIQNPDEFYALTLTGTQGRVIVRDWFESSVREVAENLAQHFADLDIVRNTPPPKGKPAPPVLALATLMAALAPLGKAEAIPDALASDFLRAALRGMPYPLAILQKANERWRAEVGGDEWADSLHRDARAAMIKAVLIRSFNQKVTSDMDPNNTNPGYLLGRLLAVIERLQQEALGDVNASVIDRYFAAASATPRAVFVRLMKAVPHYVKKMRDDERKGAFANVLDRMTSAISFHFRADAGGYPPHLDLQQQALFVLGYHHQRHWLWMSKEERQQWESRHTRRAVAAVADELPVT